MITVTYAYGIAQERESLHEDDGAAVHVLVTERLPAPRRVPGICI